MSYYFRKFLSYFPSALPTGVTELSEWARDIIELAGLPASVDSQTQALCNMIMHLPPRKSDQRPTAYVSKNWFVHALKKGASNQVASFVFQEIRKDMDAKIAEFNKSQAEVPAGTDAGHGQTA